MGLVSSRSHTGRQRRGHYRTSHWVAQTAGQSVVASLQRRSSDAVHLPLEAELAAVEPPRPDELALAGYCFQELDDVFKMLGDIRSGNTHG
jgi:hypothetical protein